MSWNNAPALQKLTASQLGGGRGAQIWGVDVRGQLFTTFQKTPGGEWTKWMKANEVAPNHQPSKICLRTGRMPVDQRSLPALCAGS